MKVALIAALRTGIQYGWGALVAWLAGLGIAAPSTAPDWVVLAVQGLITIGVTAAIRWAEARTPEGVAGVVRALARLLMLGTPAPSYPTGEVSQLRR